MIFATGFFFVAIFILAAIPAVLTLLNLSAFKRSPPAPDEVYRVSVLIPARDEEQSIETALLALLASSGIDLEVIVLDDCSRDRTAMIVERIAESDSRVHLLRGKPLPAGWCGKQHACHQLAEYSQRQFIVFLDADVRVKPDCLCRSVAFLEATNTGIVSGFPLQETFGFWEWLLLPLIHFILLGFLPLSRSRHSLSPALAAGCGQLFVAKKNAYISAGGHESIKLSLHDGIMLPRAFRRAGIRTDLFDASDTATCRMYTCGSDVLKGLAKNATEGMASPRTILPATVLLFGGQVAPALFLVTNTITGWFDWTDWQILACSIALLLSYATRVIESFRFGLSMSSAIVHPLGIICFLCIQWFGFIHRLFGLKTFWKGRPLSPQ